jgi:hypothetical protein
MSRILKDWFAGAAALGLVLYALSFTHRTTCERHPAFYVAGTMNDCTQRH